MSLGHESNNETLESLTTMMATYNVQTHPAGITQQVQAIFNLLNSAFLGNGSNLSRVSSNNAGHLRVGDYTTGLSGGDGGGGGDGGAHVDGFAGMFDSDTIAFYYDEEDLEQLCSL